MDYLKRMQTQLRNAEAHREPSLLLPGDHDGQAVQDRGSRPNRGDVLFGSGGPDREMAARVEVQPLPVIEADLDPEHQALFEPDTKCAEVPETGRQAPVKVYALPPGSDREQTIIVEDNASHRPPAHRTRYSASSSDFTAGRVRGKRHRPRYLQEDHGPAPRRHPAWRASAEHGPGSS